MGFSLCVWVLPDMRSVRKGQWGVCRSCVWYRLLKYRGSKPNAWRFPGWLVWSKVCSSENVFNAAFILHAHTLILFFCILKTLIVSFFLCTSRWKSLKTGEKTLWFYRCSILQHSEQQCTEMQQLPACWQRDVLLVSFPWDRDEADGAVLLLGPALVPCVALPCAVVPVPSACSEMTQFLSSAAAWMCLGRQPCPRQPEGNSPSQHNFKTVVILAGLFPTIVYGISVWGSDRPGLYLQKSSGVFSGIVWGFICWELCVCPEVNFVTV